MTWNTMEHDVPRAKLKALVVNDKKEAVGFQLHGFTYDGDGNCQDEDGTDMSITFKSRRALDTFLRQMAEALRLRDNPQQTFEVAKPKVPTDVTEPPEKPCPKTGAIEDCKYCNGSDFPKPCSDCPTRCRSAFRRNSSRKCESKVV